MTFRTIQTELCSILKSVDSRNNHENLRNCDLRTGTPKKSTDLRKWNEPRNLPICDLRLQKIPTWLLCCWGCWGGGGHSTLHVYNYAQDNADNSKHKTQHPDIKTTCQRSHGIDEKVNRMSQYELIGAFWRQGKIYAWWKESRQQNFPDTQCCGSGSESVGTVCFWTYRILPSTSK